MELLYFTFDGVSSEQYNLLIQNRGADLSFPSQSEFENITISPKYQNTSFDVGTNYKDRSFVFNCWIDSITEAKLQSLMNWLSVEKKGKLILDYNPDFHYNVKITGISDFKHFHLNDNDTSNYEFTLTFTTVGDSAAISNLEFPTVDNDFPQVYTLDNLTLYIYNWYDLPLYPKFTIDATVLNNFTISKNDTVHYQYEKTGTFTLDSRYGFCLDTNGDLIEKDITTDFINLGPLAVPSNIKQTIGTVNGLGNNIVLDFTPTSRTRFYTLEKNKSYLASNFNVLINDYSLLPNDTILLEYVEPTKITVTSNVDYSFNYRKKF